MSRGGLHLLCVCWFLYQLAAYGQLSGQDIEKLRQSTVKVVSNGKTSTGFLWKKPSWVVTSLHGLQSASGITITSANRVSTATVIRVLKEYDLALLELDTPSVLPILVNSTTQPAINSNLHVVGYNGKGNFSSVIDRVLRLGYNSNGKLKGLLPPSIRKELSICKSPNPEIDILYFEGTLLPGFSGSPIVDSSGKLVGVADGGLEEGAQSISWGIRAGELLKLERSLEPFPNTHCGAASNKVKFATENIQDEALTYIDFEGYRFIKTKTRTIAQMQYTVDDPVGLNQLIQGFSMTNNLDYSAFAYDIYVDAPSGATLCVPVGTTLKVQNGLLLGQFVDSQLAYLAWPARASSGGNMTLKHQASSITFENKINAFIGHNLTYEKDWNFSYETPTVFANGLIVNRVAYEGYATDFYGNFIPQVYIYGTHIAIDDTYLGMTVINLSYTQEIQNLFSVCVYNGQCQQASAYEACNLICNYYTAFSQLALGVHMGGFSNLSLAAR